MVSGIVYKGGAAAGAAEEDEELEVGAVTSIAEVSGVAVGTELPTSVETTTGGPPESGANLQPVIRVCPGVAVPLCSMPCLHRAQVQ